MVRARLRLRVPVLRERHRISGWITRRFLITGKVQGVYFRQSTRLEAQRLGIRGVARNLQDGSVEVIAHGTREAMETLAEWLHRGPSRARVARVQELEPTAEHLSAGHPPTQQPDDDQDGHSTRSFWVE
jgi:acylphosphatase